MNKKHKNTAHEKTGAKSSDLPQRVMQLEIENKRLRERAELETSSTRFTPTEIIVLLVVLVLVFSGGYVIGRYIFHLSAWLSIVAAPVLCLLLLAVIAIANFFDMF